MEMKKGILFSIDALFATIVIVSTLLLFSNLYVNEFRSSHLNAMANDMLEVLSELKVGEINNTHIELLISQGHIQNTNLSIMEQIGEFWALNLTTMAQNLTHNVTSQLFPSNLGYSITVGNENIYSNAFSGSDLVAARKMISGYEKSKPIKGSTARAYLNSIQNKKASLYSYFGGFVGQGNITNTLYIPSDITITGITIELDAGDDFQLFMNSNQCNNTYTPTSGIMTADAWNISTCESFLNTGSDNTFTINFINDLSNAFIGGGFIKIDYTTDKFIVNGSIDNIDYLPEIRGIINLYSSFYVPGTLNNLTAYIHYEADTSNNSNTLYMTIGNRTVLTVVNSSGESNFTLTDINLTKYLNYTDLSLKTIPIRVGFENVTFSLIYEGNADVALITDISGSMDDEMGSTSTGTARNCDSSSLNLSSTARLSIAKCLDKEFALDIINITGNKVGLISYEETTNAGETLDPTDDISSINPIIGNASPETGYSASGYTCICCGINSARDILVQDISTTTIISSGSYWFYNNFTLFGNISLDTQNRSWYDIDYEYQASWHNDTAILGTTNGYSYSPNVVTEIGNSLSGSTMYADLWENVGDTAGNPNDFSSGTLNQTGNTYGISGSNDGWDNDPQDGSGPFGFDDNIDYNNIVSGDLNMDSRTSGSNENRCSNDDCSGAYGILVNITQPMYTTISGAGTAIISFDYAWDDRWGNYFESADQVWTKARWTSPTSGAHYLGEDLDSGDSGSDSDPEIFTRDNPDNDYSGSYSQDLSHWIEGPGMYYLELGGKMRASQNAEYGEWEFDNIQIEISNATDYYYFRKNFTLTDLSSVQKGVVNILSDEKATIYLNGNKIDEDFNNHEAQYWNRRGINIPSNYFRVGTNVIAAELINSQQAAKFDLELIGINNSRQKAMMVMTDGVANRECAEQGSTPDLNGNGGSDDAGDDAIQAACDAAQDYGIIVYSVGYSSQADVVTIENISNCGNGIFTTSSNISGLQDFYSDVAASIVSASRHSQTIEVQGTPMASNLYGDSYIMYNYTPLVNPAEFGEIELNFEEKGFNNCSLNVTISPEIRVAEAKVTSYSSEHWTDLLTVNSQVVYNLSQYSENYTGLGDPFIVDIPPSVLQSGLNSFTINKGDSGGNSSGCSLNDTFIYTGLASTSISYSVVLEDAEGCDWNIETEDNNFTASVPSSYTGGIECNYTNASIDYSIDDSISVAVYDLLNKIDFDKDGRIDINIQEEDLEIEAIWVTQIPYLWGPAIVEVRLWQ